ncbi:hypothetical protein yfred0001_1460 [Yersinia frederiksenii ATCC 33641]|nr:hypothetical protein yfred0001_1460 [Yersinia frederiksenii ATCC 33641]
MLSGNGIFLSAENTPLETDRSRRNTRNKFLFFLSGYQLNLLIYQIYENSAEINKTAVFF